MNEERITYFAETDARNKKVKFGIKAKDRTRHVYVIGKTGMGKSTLLENMAVQDIKNGEGMAFIDPHGKTADLLLEYVPPERLKDVIYFAPFDTDHPISFNVLESVDPDRRHLVVSGLMSTFKKIWQDAWSARMEYILTNTLLALLEYPDATLLGVNRMLSDKNFRNKVVANVTDPAVKSFWVEEFANYTERMAAEAVPAIQNKIGQFTANALIRNMIGQAKSSFNIREIMDSKKIMIINLSKGRIGETNANLLGGMLITKIFLAALSRADVPDRVLKGLPNFYLFVDEFQSFANESFADILSEARKYKLNLTMAHQYIEQMEEEVRAAVFGNVGTMIVFRVGAYDAEILEKEFAPQFTAEDIVNLGFAQIYLKLMIDGIGSAPFSATTLGPIAQPEVTHVSEAIAMSRRQFTHPRAEVEQKIAEWHEPVAPPPRIPKPTASHPASAAPLPKPPVMQTQAPHSPVPHVPLPNPTVTPAPVPVAPPRPPQNPAPTPTLATHKPFAEQLRAAMPVPPAPKAKPIPPHQEPHPAAQPISLSSLAPKPAPKIGVKEATPERVNELRNALASVLKSQKKPEKREEAPKVKVEEKPKEKAPEKAPEKIPEKKPEPQPSPITPPRSSEPQEVSEDVLKSVLKVQ
jgi:energy-coupling factor transporter ATP-binding protein EcfA2